MKLCLSLNQIRVHGAQHLSDALRNNMVGQNTFFISLSLSHPTPISYRHSLYSLSSSNQIRDKGAQHLSDALRNNTVTQILSSSLCVSLIQLFLISYRRSQHSTSDAIKSEIKERNI